MFDEVKNNKVMPPVNTRPPSAPFKPVEPPSAEDIFSEVDKTDKPDVFKPGLSGSNPPRGTVIPPEMNWKNNKKIVYGLLFGALLVVGAGGYFGFKLATMVKPAAENAVSQEQLENVEVAEPVTTPEETNETGLPIEPAADVPLDSDLDGLTDAEEVAFGTNINNPDTDQDGLTDREEANVYKTDPLTTDTDGDGFNDGAEIQNGYNPKGQGKLLEINQP